MTEKRFSHKKWYNDRQLFDGDEPFAIVDVYIQAEAICSKLNELYEENQKLKQYTKQVLQNHLDGWKGVYNPIDENEVVEINIVKSIAEDLGVDLE